MAITPKAMAIHRSHQAPLGRHRGKDSTTSCGAKIDWKRFSEGGIFGQTATTAAVPAPVTWRCRGGSEGALAARVSQKPQVISIDGVIKPEIW
jgi:hypothetical protein